MITIKVNINHGLNINELIERNPFLECELSDSEFEELSKAEDIRVTAESYVVGKGKYSSNYYIDGYNNLGTRFVNVQCSKDLVREIVSYESNIEVESDSFKVSDYGICINEENVNAYIINTEGHMYIQNLALHILDKKNWFPDTEFIYDVRFHSNSPIFLNTFNMEILKVEIHPRNSTEYINFVKSLCKDIEERYKYLSETDPNMGRTIRLGKKSNAYLLVDETNKKNCIEFIFRKKFNRKDEE